MSMSVRLKELERVGKNLKNANKILIALATRESQPGYRKDFDQMYVQLHEVEKHLDDTIYELQREQGYSYDIGDQSLARRRRG